MGLPVSGSGVAEVTPGTNTFMKLQKQPGKLGRLLRILFVTAGG